MSLNVTLEAIVKYLKKFQGVASLSYNGHCIISRGRGTQLENISVEQLADEVRKSDPAFTKEDSTNT